MKFIFPQNYNFKPKLFGIIDYPTAIFCVVFGFIVFFIFNLIFNSLHLILSFSIASILPVIIFCFVGFNGENIGSVVKYIFIYFLRPKTYVFSKKY